MKFVPPYRSGQVNVPWAVGRWFGGSTKGLASLEEYDRERAHVRSLHRTFIGKGCPPLDIESELAATDAAIAEYR